MSKYEEIEKLEKQRMEYLEVDDNRTAGRIKRKIDLLEKEIKLDKLKDIEEELKLYKRFIKYKGMEREFGNWMMSDFVLKCARGESDE